MEEQQESRNVGKEEGGQPSRNSGQTGPELEETVIDEISPRLEGGQPSRNSSQTGPEIEEHRTVIDEISPNVKNWIESVEKAKEMTQSQTQWPRMPKVPQMLRGTQDFKKFYEPRVVSIGPYHHGKPHLQPGKMMKPLCAQKFLAYSNQNIKDLYKKIGSKIKDVKQCYYWSRKKKYDDETLAWMMLLDGCFLLQFICSIDDRSTADMSNVLREYQINFVSQDLFLLENQLPFGVLKLIFEGAEFNDGAPMEEMIKKFVTCTARPEWLTSEIQLEDVDEEPSHLLDLLRSAVLGKYKKSSKQKVGSQFKKKQEEKKKGDGGFCCPWKKGKQQGNPPSFRHIKELKAAGIYLKPTRGFLADVSFNSSFFFGYLKLPPIIIDDFTKPRFLNIVAYEMCLDALDEYDVTSYICFLYDLIDHADDVKELRSKHILYNLLGSDEDVAQIFNEIGNDLADPDAYRDVKADIQKHYDKRWNTWIAQVLHDHFSTPWTITAFVAAVLILFLTGLQTYYTVPRKSRLLLYIFVSVTCVFPCLVFMIRIIKKCFLSCLVCLGLRNGRLYD